MTNATSNHSPPFKPNTDIAYGSFRWLATRSRCYRAQVLVPGLDCVLGLGSNLGDRVGHFREAVRQLRLHSEIAAISALYESAPLGPPQPTYLNAAVRLKTRLSPFTLLQLQLSIERACGRERRERWGPRTLDLDLLFIVRRKVRSPGLVVPHPELTRRAFALLPLLDVMPDAADPTTGRSYADIALSVDRTEVREQPGTRAGWLE